MSENKLNFTKKSIAALPSPPQGKRTSYHDNKTPGLILRVTATGTKTFVLYRRIDGRPERVTLGRFPQMTVDQARTEATHLNGKVSAGKNPAHERRGILQEITLGDHHEQYMERHSKVYKRSWQEDRGRYNTHLSQWNNRKLSSIRRADIQKLHSHIGMNSGIYAANRLLSLLGIMFNKAIEWGWEGTNPTQRVTKFREQSRDRFLEADELPRFFKALAEEPNITARDYFVTSLLTGARASNVKSMHWDQINLERGTWTIPETKNGTPQTIPLVSEMIELLQRRKSLSSGSWVFTGTGTTGHLIEPKKAWARILQRAGIGNLRMHDLRRSLGSWQAATGANLSIIGKTLNHKNVSTTAIYARLNLDPVRESMNKATSAMLEAGGLLETGNVVKINEAKQ
jgi:integrase